MKKFLFMLASIFMLCISASADEIVSSPSLEHYMASTVTFRFDIAQYRVNKYSEAAFTLTVGDKSYTEKINITRELSEAEITFNVDPYVAGKEMTLTPLYGIYQLGYYDSLINPGESVNLSTYMMNTENGPVHNTIFHMTIYPLHYKDVDVFFNYNKLSFTQPAFLAEDEYAFVPIIEVAKELGIEDAEYNASENTVRIAVNNKYIVYYLGSKDIDVNGVMTEGPCITKFMYSTIFAPLKPFAELFRVKTEFTDEGTHYNINLDDSLDVTEHRNNTLGKAYVINERGISSDTNYLIWVSKSEFKVRVFTGSKGNWNYINSFPCAIGAPGTPTCEGQYRYYQYQNRWTYANFYCGPIMRFNGGYAIHSTLIRYNGKPYDDRVGMKISHGCVRVRPENIKWLTDTIPLYTRVYVTP